MKHIAVMAIALIFAGTGIPSAAQAGMQQRQMQQQRQAQQQKQMQQRQQRRQMQMRRYNQAQRGLREQRNMRGESQKRVGYEQEQRMQMQILKNQGEYGGRDILDYEDKPSFHYWY